MCEGDVRRRVKKNVNEYLRIRIMAVSALEAEKKL